MAHHSSHLNKAHQQENNMHSTVAETKKLNLFQAVNESLAIALETDENAVVFGEDVAFGGVFRCTMGLAERFGMLFLPIDRLSFLPIDRLTGLDWIRLDQHSLDSDHFSFYAPLHLPRKTPSL